MAENLPKCGGTKFKMAPQDSKTNCVELGGLARRSMQLQVNIQDCDVLVSVENTMLDVTPTRWK